MVRVTGKSSAAICAVFLTTLLASNQAISAKIYKIVDAETGKITFTDRPAVSQAIKQQPEKVELPETNTQPALKLPDPEPKATTSPGGYSNVTIGQPRDQSTIPPGFETIAVQLNVTPQLQEGHRVQLNFNSKKHGNPSTSISFSIGNLIRGAHNISADILDEKGKIVASTPTITVFVKRGSRNF